MKPIASSMTETDTMKGEEIAFGISAANSGWVMRSMADLYSNRELAVVREYSTNARDAMIESGHGDEPILVTLPSLMHPYFEVQDFGVGMDLKTLKEVYTQFGESTKRESDDFNGMLGFGSKSAVAYTNTFTIEAVKDGFKTIAVISRKEDFRIVLKIVLSGVETSERNGVKIQVPIHNQGVFNGVASDFYKYWIPGTVLVNGTTPAWTAGEKIDEGLYYNSNGGSYVVMGNVAYSINNPRVLFPQGVNQFDFVAYVPNGAVEFTPAREALKYSEHTKKALAAVITDAIDRFVTNAKTEIAAATTHYEAYALWTKWRKVVGNRIDNLVFKGTPIVENLMMRGWKYNTAQQRYNTDDVSRLKIESVFNTLFVVDFTPEKVSSSQKTKIKDWMKFVNNQKSFVFFTQEKTINSPWIDPVNVVSWEKVKTDTPKKYVAPRPKSTAPGRLAGTFDLYSLNGKYYSREVEQDVPSTKPLYYMTIREYNRIVSYIDEILTGFGIKEKIVLVPMNRKDKFLRNYPHAQDIIPSLKPKVQLDGASLIDADAKEYLLMNHHERVCASYMDILKVDDPELKSRIKIAKIDINAKTAVYTAQQRLARLMGVNFVPHNYRSVFSSASYIQKNYPLIKNLNWDYEVELHTHAYEYINGIYKKRKDGHNV